MKQRWLFLPSLYQDCLPWKGLELCISNPLLSGAVKTFVVKKMFFKLENGARLIFVALVFWDFDIQKFPSILLALWDHFPLRETVFRDLVEYNEKQNQVLSQNMWEDDAFWSWLPLEMDGWFALSQTWCLSSL